MLKRMAQPLQFETGAKQREQARREDDPALDNQKNIGLRSEIGEMPEDRDGKQGAAENKPEPAEKQEHVVQEHVGPSKRNRNTANPDPEGDLHGNKDANHQKVRMDIFWKLHAGIGHDLPELGHCLPDKENQTEQLHRQQEKIGHRPSYPSAPTRGLESVPAQHQRLDREQQRLDSQQQRMHEAGGVDDMQPEALQRTDLA